MSGEGLPIPAALRRACSSAPDRMAWLETLPAAVRALSQRWALRTGAPFEMGPRGMGGSAAWVAPVTTWEGGRAVLKLAMPHMEGRDEIAGLRFWGGNGTAQLLRADEALGAMLLEPCVPGTPLRSRPRATQDAVIAGLLTRLWRVPPQGAFRTLRTMIEYWIAREREAAPGKATPDAGLRREGIAALALAAQERSSDVLLATDLHAGNVLAAEREPWLAIDPKPFVGDPCFDATQHLLNDFDSLRSDAAGTVTGFADLLGVDATRVRLWMFGRLALGGITAEQAEAAAVVARQLAP